MPGDEESVPFPRTGSGADLARRVERLEGSVSGLTGAVQAIELNQKHAETVTNLRFNAIDTAVAANTKALSDFMARVEGIITGEIQTAGGRQGAELVADYKTWRTSVEKRLPADDEVDEYRAWRREVDADRKETDVVITQVKFLGNLVRIVVAGNVLAIVAAIYALLAK